jgi:hypothetical protein
LICSDRANLSNQSSASISKKMSMSCISSLMKPE